MKNFTFLLFLGLMMISSLVFSQSVSVSNSGDEADGSAILDVSSSEKGVLIPRMTSANRMAIASPATGLIVFQTDAPTGFYYNKGTSGAPVWVLLQPSENVTVQGNTFNSANNLVKLDGSGGLPAVDGSQLTNIPSSSSILFSGFTVNSASNVFYIPMTLVGISVPTTAPYAYDVDKISFISPISGVIDNLQAKQIINNPDNAFVTTSVTITLYKNDAPTALSCSLTTATGGGTCSQLDPAKKVTVNVGDKLYYHVHQVNWTSIYYLSAAVRIK